MKKQHKKNKKWETILAKSAFMTALISANSTCIGPLYEPKQPEKLNQLKYLLK